MFKWAKRFWKDEQGLELSEYAVMTALIIVAVITAIGLLAAAIAGRFGSVTTTIDGIN